MGDQPMKITPTGALVHQAQTRPKSAAFIFHEEVWTYERLAAEAERLACGLAARGVGPGDRVALHMMNRPEMIVAYYACFQLGAIAAPLRTAFKFAELAPLLQRRITWSGIALHGGALPGDPASHGCARLPFDYVPSRRSILHQPGYS